MSYPNYPNNRLIVDGVDLTERYKMILSDGYVLNPPPPKTYYVDIPYANGKLDLTECLFGDVAYGNRTQEFVFYIIDIDMSNYEGIKSDITSFLHGRAYDYEMTMDPGYAYHGRFTINSFERVTGFDKKVCCIKMSIDADPFKRKLYEYEPNQKPISNHIFTVSAIGGVICQIPNGTKRTKPVIITTCPLKIKIKNKIVKITPGRWSSEELYFVSGMNELYLNSYDIHNLTWGNVKEQAITWGNFNNKRLFEWYTSVGTIEAPSSVEPVKIEYEWSDV